MKLPRRKFLQFAGAAAVAPACSRAATAQTYPSRPITIIVPFAPGGAADVVGRVLAERMKSALGQPVIIENVSGANGTTGAGRLALARPDGYTIDVGSQSNHVLSGALYSLPYDLLNDFEPISPLVTHPYILFARQTIPANDLRELIDWLRVNPDKASAAIYAAASDLMTAYFGKETGTRFALVPYRGGAPAVQDLAAGQIDLFVGLPAQLPLARSGSIKAYAVTSDTRLVVAPDIPTFAEMGLPALSSSSWYGFFAPRGTPKDIIAKLNAVTVDALADPAVRSRLADVGEEIFPRERQTSEALGALVKADAKRFWPLMKEFGIRAE
jgi:tripartite-type tricarboxylate transporter receptor subunit TctC